MAARFRVTVNPKVLIWARETAGLTMDDAARKIGVKPDILRKWESLQAKPTVNQLRSAASAYKRPLASFYLSVVPPDVKPIHDFRALPKEPKFVRTPQLAFEIRRAIVRRELTLDLLDSLGEKASKFEGSVELEEDVKQVSQKVRRFVGISIKEQFDWKDEYEALRRWKQSIEDLDVLVFQASRIPIKVMRGFSISEAILPVIVVNSADAPRARIFTLMHELGHLMLADGGLCDLREVVGPFSKNLQTEIFCNSLAGNVLVPTEAFLSQSLVRDKNIGENWDDYELRIVAEKFKVSSQVVLRRLLTTGRINRDFYERKMQEYQDLARERRPKKSEGGPTQAVKAVTANGFRFTRLVLGGYYRDAITASDVSNYLGIKLKHLHEIQHYLERSS